MGPSILRECRRIGARIRRRFRDALAFSLAFKALDLIVLAPLAAGILRLCLWLWGRASVGNFELARFFLSPEGTAALLLVGGIMLAALYLELAGLLRILADERLHWWDAFKSSTRLFPRLVKLGLVQLALFVAAAVPFLIGIGAAYWWFWSGKDINGLLIVKPPEFWQGAGCAAVLVIAYGFLAARLFLRQLFAVPILILEPGQGIATALRASAERTRGQYLRLCGALAAWFVAQSLLAMLVLGTLHLALQAILAGNASSLTRVILATGFVFVVHSAAVTLLSVVANITFASVVLALYRPTAPAGVLPEVASNAAPSTRSFRGLLIAGLVLGLVTSLLASAFTVRDLKLHDDLEITAHRAGAHLGPENTVAALEQAIVDRADWAEIDVQLTADRKIIVMHDIDLARVGGGKRRVDQATLAEIQALDVGSSFSPKFAGERIPEFKDVLAAAGERIRLNVELKPHSRVDGDELTRRVVEEIRATGMTSRCRICSQSYESIQLARQLEPKLEIGYITAASVGDPTRLKVDFLMVKSNLAVRDLVDRAAVRGITVHAWTVNDAEQVPALLDAGVANLITDDPALLRTKLEEIRALSAPERLLLRASRAVAR